MNREDGIRTVMNGPTHVVLLGAGASIASARHNPEPNRRILPSMDDLIDVVGLRELVGGERGDGRNFEAVYSELHVQNSDSLRLQEIEDRVREYFHSLTLPSTPTLYDFLVLALRPKDVIATFNWDPFLLQAHWRNRKKYPHDLPQIVFLHGCVSLGFSDLDGQTGPAGMFSKKSRSEYVPTRLLYPVSHKDYQGDEFTREEWRYIERAFSVARQVTIFGYSAPTADIEAMRLLREAWGSPPKRDLEQFEIIDILPKDTVVERWSGFILSHHYDYYQSYFESVLAKFPRRTGERFVHRFFPSSPEEAFQEPNPIPVQFKTMEDLWEWHRPLIEAERSFNMSA